MFAMISLYLLFPPPLFSDRPRCYRRLHRCRVRLRRRRSYPYRRASRQAEPLPLSHISPICLYLSVALGICCCYVNPIQLHSLSLSPLDYLSVILCSLIYTNLYRSEPCALLAIGLDCGP